MNQNLFFIALSPNVFFELRLVRSALLIVFAITPGSHPGLFMFDPFRVGCIELKSFKLLLSVRSMRLPALQVSR